MKRLKKGERGFTLIEVLIAIAITGIIAAAITGAIFQVFNVNTRSSNRMIAVRQVQQAGKEVSKDVLQSQPDKIDYDELPDGYFLLLGWTDWEGQENDVSYKIEDNKLQRTHTIDGEPASTAPPIVAEYIDPAQTSFVLDGDTFQFTVTATVGEESETRVYEVKPRPA